MLKKIILLSVINACLYKGFCQEKKPLLFSVMSHNLRANYRNTASKKLYGCGYNIDCRGIYFHVISDSIDKLKSILIIDAYVFSDANDKDTVGAEYFRVFTARPKGPYLKDETNIIDSRNLTKNNNSSILNKSTGLVHLEIQLQKKRKLYVYAGQQYFFSEYSIDQLRK